MEKEVTLVGVVHTHEEINKAANQISNSSKIVGLEVSQNDLDKYEQILAVCKTRKEEVIALAERSYSELDLIKKYSPRIKKQFGVSNNIVNYLLRRNQELKTEDKETITWLKDVNEDKLESFILTREDLSEDLFFYELYKRAKRAGKRVVALESQNSRDISRVYRTFHEVLFHFMRSMQDVRVLRKFVSYFSKIDGPIREAHMAYQIARQEVDTAIVGLAHVTGDHAIPLLLEQRGYKVNTTLTHHPNLQDEYEIITRAGKVRQEFYESRKKSHDKWWGILEKQREKQRQGLPIRERKFTKTRPKE